MSALLLFSPYHRIQFDEKGASHKKKVIEIVGNKHSKDNIYFSLEWIPLRKILNDDPRGDAAMKPTVDVNTLLPNRKTALVFCCIRQHLPESLKGVNGKNGLPFLLQ